MRHFLAAILLVLPSAAMAQFVGTCGCNGLVPLQGLYGMDIPAHLNVTHVDGNDDRCPSEIRVDIVPPPPIRSAISGATLRCDGAGFVGKDDRLFEGEYATWRITPQDTHVPVDEDYFGGLRTSARMTITVDPPSNMIGPQTGTRHFSAQIVEGGRAPACICSDVKVQIDFQEVAMRNQGNVDGVLRGLRAKGNLLDGSFACVGGEIGAIPSAGVYSAGPYEVVDSVRGLACRQGAPSDTFAAAMRKVVNAQRPPARDGSSATSQPAASVDPSTCALNPAKVRECQTQVFFDAAYQHEKVHQEQCRRMNASPELKAHTDALRAALSRHPSWQEPGALDFLTPSYLYFNNPINLGRFEHEAYQTSHRILKAFHDSYCSG